MGYCSNIYKEKQERAAQSNSVTTKNNTPSQTNPKTVQAQINRGASLLNPIEDLVSAAHEVAPQLPQMALDFGKSAVNNFTKQGLANTPAAIARGVASGAVDFVPSVAGLGVDLVNSIVGKDVITMPEERRRPLGTALEQWRDMQETSNNLAIPVVQGQNPANFGIKPVNNIMQTIAGSNEGADKAQFAEMMGQFVIPMGVANQAKNAAIAAKTATKVANEGSRIASKLSDAQKVKYANQIKKMAENNVAKNVAPKTPMSNLVDNVATGGALGMLEGNNLQERFQNGIGGAALGGALTGVHAGAKKIANSKKGVEIKDNIKDTFNKLTDEYDGLSKTVAGIDNALNTNLSESANDLTKIRKEYGKLKAKDQNYKRNISDEERQLLDEAGDLTEAQQTEIFERNKYGARERALRLSQEAKDKLAEQQEQKHSTTTKSKEESEQWWKDAEEREKALAEEKARQEEIDKQELVNKLKQSKEAWEKQKNDNSSTDDLSHVKSETDINTPDNSKTLNPEQRTVSHNKITKLESGKAEGSDSNFYYEQKAKPKTKQIDADDAYIKPDENGEYVKEAQGNDYINYVDENTTKTNLEPTDTKSLRKEIDEWNNKDFEKKSKINDEHLPDIEENKSQIDGITKRYLNATGIYKIPSDLNPNAHGKIVKLPVKLSNGETIMRDSYVQNYRGLAHRLRSPQNLNNVHKTVDALTNLQPSVEVRNALTHIYKQSSNNIKKYIDKQIKDKGLNYNLDSNIELKSKRQLAKEQKQVRTFIEDEKNTGIPQVPEKTSGEPSHIDPMDSRTNAKKIADAINQGRNAIPEKIKGLKAKTIDIIKYSKVYKEGSKLSELAKKFVNDIETEYTELKERQRGYFDRQNSIKLNFKDASVFTHDHEVAHVILDRYVNDSTNLELNYRHSMDIEDIGKAISNIERIESKHGELLDEINEYKKFKNKPDITAKDLKNVLTDEEYKTYREYEKYYFDYKNTINEQFADCVSKGYFDGTPVEFIEIYDRIKPEFDKLVEEGKLYGTETELQGLIRDEFRRNQGENKGNAGKTEQSRDVGSESNGRMEIQKGDRRGSPANESRGERSEGRGSSSSNKEQETLDERYDEYGNLKKDIKFFDLSKDKFIHRTLNWFDKTKDKHTKFYHEFLEAAPEIKKFTDAYKTINDKREAFFREFGTYTDERMKARLFKQSKSGEGVYFQQGTKRSDKVEWGKESNEKVGFTGKKQLEGISEKGTTQEGLARGFSDVVRMEHTRNCINFLKENFGEQREGFVPVNSKLLANAMYFGKSKAWYETIRKGKEAIDNTFDKNNAKEWNELYRTTEADKSDIYLPKDLLDLSITGEKELPLDYLSTYGKMRGTKGKIKGMAKVAGAMLDFYTDRFKRKVLTSASFFANNRFGNQIMLAMTADKPQDYIKGIADALRLKESEVPSEILESTLAEAIQKEANSGIRKYFSEKNNTFDKIARILDGDEIDTKTLSGLSKTTAKASNWIISKPNALFRSLSKLTGEINERFERFERKQAFSQSLSQMQRQKILKNARQFAGLHELAEIAKNDKLIREAVIDKVADALGDYNNFSKFEKNVLKKIIPFYAWNRTITRHIIHLAKENPVKATLVAYETYRLLHQDDGLEDYQHGSLKLGIRNDRTKSDVVINKASIIPYNTLFDMVSGENIGSFSPLITKPVEAIRGEKFFKPASEITSKNWKRTTQNKKEGYVNTKTGEFREGKAPISSRAGYIAKDAMETVYPMAGSPMTKGIPDAIKHYNETGEFLFPDKQYDASLGGFYHGDKAGKKKVGKKIKDRTLSAKNRLDLKYQITNRTLGLGIQPEHKVNSKEQKEKYQRQRKRMRGN